MIENQFEAKVKVIHSDNGPKFFLKDFFTWKEILHQTSCVAIPQQNERVERKHQHILNVARALMFQSHIPGHFWSYVVKNGVHLMNHFPSPTNWNKTLFEILYEQILDFQTLKVFGCMAYVSIYVANRHKFDPRSRRGVFLGFQNGTKGYVF